MTREAGRQKRFGWKYFPYAVLKVYIGRQEAILKCGGRCFSFITDSMILDSSVVEHSAVNRRVVGSSPTRGVMKTFHRRRFMECFYLYKSPGRLSGVFDYYNERR